MHICGESEWIKTSVVSRIKGGVEALLVTSFVLPVWDGLHCCMSAHCYATIALGRLAEGRGSLFVQMLWSFLDLLPGETRTGFALDCEHVQASCCVRTFHKVANSDELEIKLLFYKSLPVGDP